MESGFTVIGSITKSYEVSENIPRVNEIWDLNKRKTTTEVNKNSEA